MFSGTIDANEYQGLPVVTAMNKMGFSANTAGNHIFDYPLDVIKRQAAAANFPILGANIVEAAGDRVAEPFTICNVAEEWFDNWYIGSYYG